MKKYLSFLLVFFFALSYSQTGRDTVAEQKYIDEQKIEDFKKCNAIIKDFENISFKKLEKIVVENIIFDNTKRNIIIDYRPSFSLNSVMIIDKYDYTPVYCNYSNPLYNQSDFWTKKNIKLMVKKFSKNLIPRNGTRDEFIYDEITSKSTTNFRKLSADTRKQQEGKYIKIYNETNQEVQNFFYFPFHRKENLVLENDVRTVIRNYDELHLKFTNYLDKIVTVKYKYNEDNSIFKTYQYQNKKWVEIPTIEEYKF
ncbi:hypothetical protein [Frigoriflavimonas asaccharolytica]|nr:hypothetical protein [Frigoriflavimonas asaccharolytica]